MIQSILFFVLGFLSAALLALMIAPSVWRRAVALTRRRLEATVPMTLNEIQAEKDRMRAEFAMATRRLEISLQSSQEKVTRQTIEIDRQREEIKLLSEECAAKSRSVGELEVQASHLRAELRKREDELQQINGRIGDAQGRLEGRAAEVEKLERLLEEANLASSNRQIELVARETEVDKLTGDINILRSQQREAEKRARELSAENKTAQEALRAERKRAAEAEKKLDKMIASASDNEEKLSRREKELARLREEARRSSENANDLRLKLTKAEKERDRLQAEVAALASRSSENGGQGVAAMEEHAPERSRHEERLAALVRENKKLRSDLAAAEQAKPAGQPGNDGQLREQIQSIAAEMVNLTAALEGPDSPIRQALAGDEKAAGGGAGSLADRIRTFRKNGSSGSRSLPG